MLCVFVQDLIELLVLNSEIKKKTQNLSVGGNKIV